jgi:hypothetical protein
MERLLYIRILFLALIIDITIFNIILVFYLILNLSLTRLIRHYPEILTALARTLPTEKSGKVLDNICGAISRLIIANTNAVPIDQV